MAYRRRRRTDGDPGRLILRTVGGVAAFALCAGLALGLAGFVYRAAIGGDRPMPTPYFTASQRTPSPLALATLRPLPTPAPTPSPTPTPTPTPPAAGWVPEDGAYTIAWMSDTQYYSKDHPDTFRTMTRFLDEQQIPLNLRYVVHTGDLVHNHVDEAQWAVADEAMDALEDIPYGVLAGNHDIDGTKRDFSMYRRYFGAARMAERAHYGGTYNDNQGHYDLLSVGVTSYIFVYMSYSPTQSDLAWVNQVFAQYPDRVGVLCVHDYFDSSFNRSNAGQLIYDAVVKPNPNVYLVLCGHRYANGYKEEWIDDTGDAIADRRIYQMMLNYQTEEEGGSGYLRLLQVHESKKEIRVLSYSPLKDDFDYHDGETAQPATYANTRESFTIPVPW